MAPKQIPPIIINPWIFHISIEFPNVSFSTKLDSLIQKNQRTKGVEYPSPTCELIQALANFAITSGGHDSFWKYPSKIGSFFCPTKMVSEAQYLLTFTKKKTMFKLLVPLSFFLNELLAIPPKTKSLKSQKFSRLRKDISPTWNFKMQCQPNLLRSKPAVVFARGKSSTLGLLWAKQKNIRRSVWIFHCSTAQPTQWLNMVKRKIDQVHFCQCLINHYSNWTLLRCFFKLTDLDVLYRRRPKSCLSHAWHLSTNLTAAFKKSRLVLPT